MEHLNRVVLFLLAACCTGVYAQTERTHTRDGNKQYEAGKFSDAEADYKKALEQKNNFPEAVFNLGDAVYRQQRFDEAARQFQLSAQTHADSLTRAQAWHNLGNSALSQEKFEDAVKAYKNALKLNPRDADTRYNLAYANAKLKQQQQNQQNNQDQKQNQKQNDKKEQEQQNKNDKQDQQNKDQQGKNEQQKQPQQKPQLSKQDAEKLLQALQNEEQKANQKMLLKQAKPADVKIQKDW